MLNTAINASAADIDMRERRGGQVIRYEYVIIEVTRYD